VFARPLRIEEIALAVGIFVLVAVVPAVMYGIYDDWRAAFVLFVWGSWWVGLIAAAWVLAWRRDRIG